MHSGRLLKSTQVKNGRTWAKPPGRTADLSSVSGHLQWPPAAPLWSQHVSELPEQPAGSLLWFSLTLPRLQGTIQRGSWCTKKLRPGTHFRGLQVVQEQKGSYRPLPLRCVWLFFAATSSFLSICLCRKHWQKKCTVTAAQNPKLWLLKRVWNVRCLCAKSMWGTTWSSLRSQGTRWLARWVTLPKGNVHSTRTRCWGTTATPRDVTSVTSVPWTASTSVWTLRSPLSSNDSWQWAEYNLFITTGYVNC